MKKYKFSVVIPIYNVENYLEATIESIINQTIGFEDNIELILINDGSTDNSESICLKYKEKYPNNIIYFKQKNSGVSVARNKGLSLATGELINFFDSDDLWSKHSFEIVYNNYIDNKDISLFSTKMKFFELIKGSHPLNYKYKETKIVDILEDYDYPQLSASSIFIKTDVAKKYQFDKSIKYSEDNKFINEIIFDEQKVMMVKGPIYRYRKRIDKSSTNQKQKVNKDWYLVTPKKVYQYLFDLSKKKFGKVIKYIQYLVMYDLEWRIKAPINKELLTDEEVNNYILTIKELLKDIDDNIILEQKNIVTEYKIYSLQLKYNQNILDELEVIDDAVMFKDNEIFSLNKRSLLNINVININKDKMINIVGQLNGVLTSLKCDLYYRTKIGFTKIKLKPLELTVKKCDFVESTFCNKMFDITIDNDVDSIEFYVKIKGEMYALSPSFTSHARLNHDLNTYYSKYNIMIYLDETELKITDNHLLIKFILNITLIFQLLKRKKISVLFYRLIMIISSIFKHKEIWLISDRTLVANDNGMHFFKYVNKINDQNIKPYFVISKNSQDYDKMKKYGKVINYNSFKYKICFLLSDKIISSQADDWVINAFGTNARFYRDLYKFDFVFLQHGITQNDLSGWLNKIKKNIKLITTTSKKEYESIITGNYFYDKNVVKLTGLSRYDNLVDKKKKIIAIMPTWRSNLGGKVKNHEGTRVYNPLFKESDYFKFYNNLINDKKLLDIMEENGYKGVFVTHPSHEENGIDFKGNKIFEVINGYADYQSIFSVSSLLVSDYSSVLFDFAYLNKPIIYTQFDKEDFYKYHIFDQGYFSYEKDGFGPVLYDYDSTVNEIIKCIKNGCKLENIYKKRIDKFYQYHDKLNSKRIYEEIKKLK